MKIQPLHDRIVVQAAEKEEKSAGGIILPDSAQEKPLTGKVLAVGPGKTLDSGTLAPVDVKKGDTVLYGKYSGTEVTVGKDEYVILRSDDVLGIVEKSAPAKKAVVTKKPAAKKKAAKKRVKAGVR